MTVIEYTYPDGSTSYQLVTYTDAELDAMFAAPDAATWIAANATVTETIAVTA